VKVLTQYGANFCRNADTVSMQVFKKNVKGSVFKTVVVEQPKCRIMAIFRHIHKIAKHDY
jgi:hypothetical protein